jgi:hypothetical protein
MRWTPDANKGLTFVKALAATIIIGQPLDAIPVGHRAVASKRV